MMKMNKQTLQLIEAKTTNEWKTLAKQLTEQYRKLRFENEIDITEDYEKESWEKYHAYLMLESITLKYSFSTRRSLKMKQDLLKAVEYAVNTTATIL